MFAAHFRPKRCHMELTDEMGRGGNRIKRRGWPPAARHQSYATAISLVVLSIVSQPVES
jgi:hypothetical protein